MNPDNVKAAIAIMQRAKNLQMCEWQRDSKGMALGEYDEGSWKEGERSPIATDIDTLHSCGNAACFAGYVAISEEFQRSGGSAKFNGEPWIPYPGRNNGTASGVYAIACWLDVSEKTARNLVYGQNKQGSPAPGFSTFYNKNFSEVTPADVISKLELLLEGRLDG